MVTRFRRIAPVALSLATACASATRQPEVPSKAVAPARIAIVSADSGRNWLQESFPKAVAGDLQAFATSENFQIIPLRDIDATLLSGPLMQLNDNDARELAKLMRAIVIVKVTMSETRPQVTARALAIYPSDRAVDTLLVIGATAAAVAEGIARRVATEFLPRARGKAEYFAQHPSRPENRYPYLDFQVDRQATFIPNDSLYVRPASPRTRESRATEPSFIVQFVIDSLGVPEPGSLKVIRAPSDAAAASARRMMPWWRFTPATISGSGVPELVQAELEFAPGMGLMRAPSVILIEALRTTDTLSAQVAILLRPQLAQHLPGRGSVVRKTDIDATLMQGYPGGDYPRSWGDVREIAKLLRADIVIDVRAESSAGQVTIASYRFLPSARAIDTLPPVYAPSLDSAVHLLARQLARDTLFRR